MDELLADADEIESAMAFITRPSAQMRLQSFIDELRKEGEDLPSTSTAAAAVRSKKKRGLIDLSDVPPQPPISKVGRIKEGASKYTGVSFDNRL